MNLKTKTILKNAILGMAFLMPFIVFLVPDSMFFPFITGKNFAFRVLVELMVGAWLFLAILDPAYRPKKSWILAALTALVSVMLVADLFGENISKSIWSNYERMEGWITLIHLLGYFVVLTTVLTTEKLWMRMLQVSLGASVIMGIYAFFQHTGVLETHQGDRLDGTLGNATYLAVYALMHAFFAVFVAMRTNARGFLLGVYGAIALLNLFMLYNTATRGSILGLIGGMILTALLIALFAKEYGRLRKWAAGTLIVVFVLLGGFLAVKDTTFVQESDVLKRFANISLEDKTTRSRFIIWGMALEGFQEHPILGWGQGNFDLLFNEYYEPNLYDQEPFFDRAHNVFMDWLVAGGILGLLAYLSIFAAILYMLWLRPNPLTIPERSVFTGLLAAYFFHNIFVFDNLISYMLFTMLAAYVHVRTLPEDKKPMLANKATNMPAHVLGAVLIVVTVFTVYAVNAKAYFANKAIIQAMAVIQQGDVEGSKETFKQAIAYDSFGTPEAREHFARTAQQVVQQRQLSEQVRQNYVDAAFTEMQKQIQETPNNARYHLILGNFASNIGQYDMAIEYLNNAIELSPGKQDIYFAVVYAYINKGEREKALEVAKEAYDIYPANPNARDTYGLAAIYAGDYEKAEEILIPAYGTITVPTDQFANAFASQGDYERVISIWKERIAEEQRQGNDNAQLHVSLAAAYLQNNDRQLAIEELEKAIELNPGFKEQGQYYIDEIKAGRTP